MVEITSLIFGYLASLAGNFTTDAIKSSIQRFKSLLSEEKDNYVFTPQAESLFDKIKRGEKLNEKEIKRLIEEIINQMIDIKKAVNDIEKFIKDEKNLLEDNNEKTDSQANFKIIKKIVREMKKAVEGKTTYFTFLSHNKVTVKKMIYEDDLYIATNIAIKENTRTIITGKAGCGKSLFFYKTFIDKANEFLQSDTYILDTKIPLFISLRNLNTNTVGILDFLKTKNHQLESISDFKFALFLDGLDELKIDFTYFIKSEFYAQSVLLSSRKDYYNDKRFDLIKSEYNFQTEEIKEWDDNKTENFIDRYCLHEKFVPTQRELARKFLFEKRKSISSPFLISLYLSVIKANPKFSIDSSDENKIEVSILECAIEEYFKNEISRNQDDLEPEIVIDIIAEACWIYYSNTNIKTSKKYYFDTLNGIFNIDKNKIDKYVNLFFEQKPEDDEVHLVVHEKFLEYMVAKRIISNVVWETGKDDFFCLQLKPEIIWYVTALCGYDDNRIKLGEFCQKKYLEKRDIENWEINVDNLADKISYQKGVTYLLNCLLLYSRSRYDHFEKFIINQIDQVHQDPLFLPTAVQMVLYDSIQQYSKDISIRKKYEDLYYNRMLNDQEFERIQRGCRLTYYECADLKKGYIIFGDLGGCDWQPMLEIIKNHFREDELTGKHYFSRRLELYTISKLFEADHKCNKDPDFINKLKGFLSSIKDKIYERAETPKDSEYDRKVKECFDEHILRLL